MIRKVSSLSAAILLALSTAPALAQNAPAPPGQAPQTLDTLIVTGTRVSDRTVAESASPIDIITSEALQATGTSELATALARALPSLNFPRPAVTDGTSAIRPAQLRGLAPDQVLVLVNGKRRHTSSLLNVNGSMGRGSAPVDLNTIPIAAIERVEVLRDGASAQYGSDAIAGVVNIVLKGAGEGGSIGFKGGQYSAGDGAQYQLAGDVGIALGGDRGFLHVAGQFDDQDSTNRAGPYAGASPGGANPQLGQTKFVYGDPEVEAQSVSLNSEFKLTDSITAYAFGIFGNRDITSFAFYRAPGDARNIPSIYPDGFVPEINNVSQDRSLVAGVRGDTASGWKWDASYNYGYNHLEFFTRNTLNTSLGASSPRSFYDGALETTQNIFNLDLSKALDWGLAYPVTLAFGAEYRDEKWNQSPGRPDSYFQSGTLAAGAQGFGGFSPANAGHYSRHSYALYADLEADFTDKFSGGAAVRYEDYSDFGSETSGKLSARYAFTDQVALRATVASGFRAPSLPQQHYTAVTSNFNGTVFLESGTFPVDHPVAQALGAEPLEPETSLSYSLGLVLQPIDRLYITLDAYQIEVDDRIILSGNLQGAALVSLVSSLGYPNVTSVRYFTNAVDTRTRGVDLVGSYALPLGSGTLNLTSSFGYNKTEITHIAPNPPELQSNGLNLQRVSRDEQGRIEEVNPKTKFYLGATWNLESWDFNLATTRYGDYTVRNATSAANDQRYGDEWVLDASASYKLQGWTFTLGADNLLDSYPDKTIFATSNSGQFPYSSYSPFGFNGAYVYGRIGYRW